MFCKRLAICFAALVAAIGFVVPANASTAAKQCDSRVTSITPLPPSYGRLVAGEAVYVGYGRNLLRVKYDGQYVAFFLHVDDLPDGSQKARFWVLNQMYDVSSHALEFEISNDCGMFAASANTGTLPHAITTSACPYKVLVVGSRGSGDSENGNVFVEYGWMVARGMSNIGGKLAISIGKNYPEKQIDFISNPYPATGDKWTIIGAAARLPFVGRYNKSVAAGKTWLRQYLVGTSAKCPNLRYYLIGYSQGAELTADVYQSLPEDLKQSVLGVALFGDPKFNGKDPADSGNFNKKSSGARGRRPLFGANTHVVSFCHRHDPVCEGLVYLATDQTKHHKDYGTDDKEVFSATFALLTGLG